MKHLSIMMALFLIVGCQTTQLPEETKPEEKNLVSNVEKQDKQIVDETLNPFADVENIDEDTMVSSQKPIICGRMDTMLNRVYQRYGEVPVVYGHAENITIAGEQVESVITITHNSDTGSYTFFEQMPTERRLICMLSGGKAKFKLKVSGLSS